MPKAHPGGLLHGLVHEPVWVTHCQGPQLLEKQNLFSAWMAGKIGCRLVLWQPMSPRSGNQLPVNEENTKIAQLALNFSNKKRK